MPKGLCISAYAQKTGCGIEDRGSRIEDRGLKIEKILLCEAPCAGAQLRGELNGCYKINKMRHWRAILSVTPIKFADDVLSDQAALSAHR
jgi:hypothetical protein